jgi:hypothetical protein
MECSIGAVVSTMGKCARDAGEVEAMEAMAIAMEAVMEAIAVEAMEEVATTVVVVKGRKNAEYKLKRN